MPRIGIAAKITATSPLLPVRHGCCAADLRKRRMERSDFDEATAQAIGDRHPCFSKQELAEARIS